MCTPVGTECYKSIKDQEVKCLIPCKGVFADVQKITFEYNLHTIEDFKNILYDYRGYKAAYSQGYSADVGGMLNYVSAVLMVNTCFYPCGYA